MFGPIHSKKLIVALRYTNAWVYIVNWTIPVILLVDVPQVYKICCDDIDWINLSLCFAEHYVYKICYDEIDWINRRCDTVTLGKTCTTRVCILCQPVKTAYHVFSCFCHTTVSPKNIKSTMYVCTTIRREMGEGGRERDSEREMGDGEIEGGGDWAGIRSAHCDSIFQSHMYGSQARIYEELDDVYYNVTKFLIGYYRRGL